MKINRWESNGDKWEFVKVSKKEALALIASLTKQLLEENPNTGRLESRVDGGYFTIGVTDDEIEMPYKKGK